MRCHEVICCLISVSRLLRIPIFCRTDKLFSLSDRLDEIFPAQDSSGFFVHAKKEREKETCIRVSSNRRDSRVRALDDRDDFVKLIIDRID